jgi:hypothetical protein
VAVDVEVILRVAEMSGALVVALPDDDGRFGRRLGEGEVGEEEERA